MAVSFIGASNLIATNGTAPGAITPHASTVNGDLLVAFHYSRATGGNETVAAPAGWNVIFNSVTANSGLVAAFWRVRQAGDTTYTFTVTNHTTGTSGETILEWIETFRGQASTPITKFTASLSTWASSLTIGPIAAPATATVVDGGMAVVFGGRFENVLTQTTLTGDNLTWSPGTRNDTTLGLDAGAITQRGLNSSGSTQTVTAKSITTTGTTQAGAGRMFIIEPLPTFNVSGTPSLPLITVSGNIDFTLSNNDRDISGNVSIPQITGSGSITNTDPVYNVSGNISIGIIQAGGSITNTDPVYSISGSFSIPQIAASGDLTNTPPNYDVSGDVSIPGLVAEGNIDFNLSVPVDLSGDVSIPLLTVSGNINSGNAIVGSITIPLITITGNIKNNNKIHGSSPISNFISNPVSVPNQIIINPGIDLAGATNLKIKYISPQSVAGEFPAIISDGRLVASMSDTDIIITGKWLFYASVTINNIVYNGEKIIIRFKN